MKPMQQINLREHLLMMLEAMQYKGTTEFMDNDRLRDLVEEQKIKFLRQLQEQQNGRFN